MTVGSSDRIAGIIAIDVQLQENGQYVCLLSHSLSDSCGQDIQCHGQTREHAIAVALEELASAFREVVEEQQEDTPWDFVERSQSGKIIDRHFHVILHYERIAEDESKFEAMHNTILGNTVVENAKVTVIEIEPDLAAEPLVRSQD